MKEIPFKNLYTRLTRKTLTLFERAKLTEYTFMIVLAVIIGLLGGFAAVGITSLINFLSDLSFPGAGNLLENIKNAPWYLKILIPVIGGLIVGPIIYFLAPEAKGHGVPEVMQAILLKGGKIRPRVAIVKAIASSITIGTGGSVGREGPIIQIGSSIGSTIGQFFKLPSNRLKTLVGCGAAAGIAAAFNAPVAGALFAMEIILMEFTAAQFSPIVISSVMATVVSHSLEGDFAAFQVPAYSLVSPYELIFYFILGLIAGLVSFLFIKTLYYSEDFFDNRFHIPEYFKPAIGGFGLGLLALYFPDILGIGYNSIENALHGNMLWYLAFALIFMKILASSVTLGSGGSGGIFAPSLFMGATLGCFFGGFVHSYFPEISADAGAYALVAMGGLVAGTTRAPITAIIIVFELTGNYHIILPLMITCITSMILSSKLSRESIYTLKLLLRNIGIKEGAEINIMKSIFVKEVYTNKYDSVFITDNFQKVVNRFITGRGVEFPVVDSQGRLHSVISIDDIKELMFDKDALMTILIAGDFSTKDIEALTPDDNCETALDRMRYYNMAGLPVVDSLKSKKLLGMIWRKDISDAYQEEIERREITSSLASKITMRQEETQVQFHEGYSIAEIKPPKSFIGRSISSLNIRTKYGVDVLSIKTKEKRGDKITAIPSPKYTINEDDTLIVAGEIKNINHIKTLD